ncbi:MAG: carbohydrate deacetylase [Blastocatellales bacterium]
MRYLIVNADDFGLTPGVNRAIIEGHRRGIITSATLMVNMPAFDEAVELAKSTPSLGVGLHFNITQGSPVSPVERVRSIIDRSGNFPGTTTALLIRNLAGRLERSEIENELRAQIERMLSAGIRPTHIDTHKHSHAIPIVLDAIIDVAREYGIPAVRKLRQPFDVGTGMPPIKVLTQALGAAAVGALCRLQERRLESSGLALTSAFYGISRTGFWDRGWLLDVIANLPEGASELMCHPGYDDSDLRSSQTRLTSSRQAELEILTDETVSRAISDHGIDLIHYGRIASL